MHDSPQNWSFALLEDRAFISITGEDSRTFLQGLITQDVLSLTEEEWRYAAFLSPQGKILFDFFMTSAPASIFSSSTSQEKTLGIVLDCRADARDALIARLKFYQLRAKVTITPLGGQKGREETQEAQPYSMVAVWRGPDLGSSIRPLSKLSYGREVAFQKRSISFSDSFFSSPSSWPSTLPNPPFECPTNIFRQDPRHPALGYRLLLPTSETEKWKQIFGPNNPGAYELHRLLLGIPEAQKDFLYGETFPHEANLDQMKALDFHKGCYIGQEIISRVHHRSTTRKRILRFKSAQPFPAPTENLPQVGATLEVEDRVIGIVTSLHIFADTATILPERATYEKFPPEETKERISLLEKPLTYIGLARVQVNRAQAAAENQIPVTLHKRPIELYLPEDPFRGSQS